MVQTSLKCLSAVFLSLNSFFEGACMPFARGIIRIFQQHVDTSVSSPCGCTTALTFTVFSASDHVFLNSFCYSAFKILLLSVIIYRLKYCESNTRLKEEGKTTPCEQ